MSYAKSTRLGGITLICFDNMDKVKLTPDASSKFKLKIAPCSGKKCETDTNKIDDFFGSFWFELYTITEKFN